MDPDRWRRITALFHAALAQQPDRRSRFLEEECRDDPSLRADVEAMLAGDDRAARAGDPFHDRPPAATPGTLLGPYRIENLLGAGGMGEVYKARDTRLNRTVALKVLPSAFSREPELRERFDREAQAIAALRHPNICVLHDIGDAPPIRFLVMEYLEGETLEARLKKGALPLDRALQHAIEIADALAAAHRGGITHRDLKPGNVMLAKESARSTGVPQVKLLDFGLAKFGVGAGAMAQATAMPTTPPSLTTDGAIVGTFQYMAPEQLEGNDADARTDIFAFGALLHEMVTGRRAFSGETRSNLIASILRDQPPALSATQSLAPPALDLLVQACLAKDPDARLQSAHDVALQLRWIRDGHSQPAPIASTHGSWRRWTAAVVAVVIGIAALVGIGAYTIGRRSVSVSQPTFKQLTFRRGFVDSARFAPDGQTVVYSAAWDGKPRQIFSMRVDTGESLPLPLPEGRVLSISRTGELALLIKAKVGRGMLARVPLGGGGVRELTDQVQEAAWAPDGSLAALLSDRIGHSWLEYPLGRRIHEWSESVVELSVSPDGSTIAVKELNDTGGGWITFLDRGGIAKRISGEFPAFGPGLVWTRRGDEVWFSASDVGLNFGIHAVTRTGRQRVLHKSLGSELIQDLDAEGRALIVDDLMRAGMVALAPGEQHERELSWFDFGRPGGLSADGRILSFNESGAGAGRAPIAFVRQTDGSPAIRLGEGSAGGLSPDGSSVLLADDNRRSLKIVPIGAGQTRRLDTGNLLGISPFGTWTADGTRIVFGATEPGRPRRMFVVPIAGGPPRAVTPEGVGWLRYEFVVSPDSRYVLGSDRQAKIWQYPLDGGVPLPLNGLIAGDSPLRWSVDGRSIWVLGPERSPARIFRLEIETGRRTFWREIASADPAGLDPEWFRFYISADGKSYVYGYNRSQSDLYLADGVK